MTRYKPRGRPNRAEVMNIIRHDVEDVAEAIKVRIRARGKHWEVHVGPDGEVYMDQPCDPKHANPPPDAWLIGTYGTKTPIEVIEEDLVERLREIRPQHRSAA